MFALILLLCLSNPGHDQSERNNASDHARKENAKTQTVSSSAPQTATEAPQKIISDQKNSSPDNPKRWLGMTESEWVISILTGIYVGLTGFYARVSHKTLAAIEQQGESGTFQFNQQLAELKRTSDATKQSAEAAEASAKAAKDTFEAMTRAARIEQRAWVAVYKGDYGGLSLDKTVRVTFWAKNTGRTPARKVESGAELICIPKGEKPAFTYSGSSDNMVRSVSVIFPEGEISLSKLLYLSAEDAIKLKSEEIVLWFYGRIVYLDIFGKEHWTTFCYFLGPNGGITYHSDYNDMDET